MDLISIVTTDDRNTGLSSKYGDTGMHGQYGGLGSKLDASIWRGAYDVIAAILSIPPEEQVPLLQEHEVNNDEIELYVAPKLTFDASQAFTSIFSRYARHSEMMTLKELVAYVDQGLGIRLNGQQLRKKFDRYDLTKDGKLHLRGFLKYQAHEADRDAGAVWRDLYAHGFNCRLQDTNLSANQTDGLSEVLDVSKNPIAFKSHSREMAALECISFYERGFQLSINNAHLIMRRVSVAYNSVAIKLIVESLQDILEYTETFGNQNSFSVVRPCLGLVVIRVLLTTDHPDPEAIENWMKNVLFSQRPEGLLHQLARMENEIVNSKTTPDKKFKLTRMQGKLLDIFRILREIPSFHEYTSRLMASDMNIKHLLAQHLQEPLVASTSSISTLPSGKGKILCTSAIKDPFLSSRLKQSKVVVSGAHHQHCNGEYLFWNFQSDQVGKTNVMFRRFVAEFEGKDDQLFLVHRCRLHNGGYNWYISHIPDGKKPGEQTDKDFYEKYSQYDSQTRLLDDMTPPKMYWKLSGEKTAVDDDVRVTWIPGPDDFSSPSEGQCDRDADTNRRSCSNITGIIDSDLDQITSDTGGLGISANDIDEDMDPASLSVDDGLIDSSDLGVTDGTGGSILNASLGLGSIHGLATSTFDSLANLVSGRQLNNNLGVVPGDEILLSDELGLDDAESHDSASSERADPSSDRSLSGPDGDDFDMTHFNSS